MNFSALKIVLATRIVSRFAQNYVSASSSGLVGYALLARSASLNVFVLYSRELKVTEAWLAQKAPKDFS